MRGRLLACAGVVSCATACLAAPAPASAARWHTFHVSTGGFSIALPSPWVDVSSATTAVLKTLARNPALTATAKLASQSDAIKLLASDPSSNGQAYMDAGAQRVGVVSVSTLATATATELRRAVPVKGTIAGAAVSLPAGKAYSLRFELAPKTGPVETLEYLIVRDQVEYVMAFTAPLTSWKTYFPQFEQAARTFRFVAGPNLSTLVLAASQVGAGYRQAAFLHGDSIIGEATLDLCDGTYPSEALRTGRLQVRYLHAAPGIDVSNEVVTYVPGGAQQALTEVAAVARSCARKPVVRKQGASSVSFSVTPISDSKLLPGAVAVRIDITGKSSGKRFSETAIAVYQVKGDTLSGVYAFVGKGTTAAEATRVGLHAAEQSARNLGGNALVA